MGYRTHVHSIVIFAIVSCKQVKVWSMGGDEPSSTSTLSKQLFSSMAINPPLSTIPTTSSIGF
jgi:hypothetical protein